MSSGPEINRELSLGEVISKALDIYRRGFIKYFLLFLVVDAVVGIGAALAISGFHFAALPAHPTPSDLASWWASAQGGFRYLALTVILAVVLGALAGAVSIRMASEAIEGRESGFESALRFGISKLVSVVALTLLLSVVVGLGFVALVVPGIILAVVFSVAMPSLLIEKVGVLGSLGRSRELVGHRWLKTFATFVVLLVIVIAIGVVVDVVAGLIGAAFGGGSVIISSALGAVAAPLFPVALTVYFYSNRARVAPPTQAGSASVWSGAAPQSGMKFCPNCGAQLLVAAAYCSNCGARQPASV